jgi:S-(hydroxymethyl)glutathione dehydrogenase/alcohol dehydrogenase
MPFAPAALLSCGVVTGWGAAVSSANVQPGDTVAVIGCGGVGLAGLQGARSRRAAVIVAVDVVDEKLEFAKRLGATHTINSARVDDPVAALLELTDGVGADSVLDFVGTDRTVSQALRMTARGGDCVVTGISAAEWCISTQELLGNGRTLKGNYLGMVDLRETIADLISRYSCGELLLDELISRTLPLGDLDKAFQAMRDGGGTRSVITFDIGDWKPA